MYIGVDGGGTKTAFVLINQAGEILATHEEGTCSYLTIGINQQHAILERGVMELIAEANISLVDLDFAFFGLTAHGEDQQMTARMNDMPADYLGRDEYQCANDMVCGWAGSLAGEDGINIVAGTGSICYGVYEGRSARCSGWGELFGDEGSAYWVACQGLNIFTKMSDGRLPKGLLHSHLSEHFPLEEDLDLPGVILGDWAGDRGKIAALAPLIAEAAKAGDVEARDIFNRAGQELAAIVKATRGQIDCPEGEAIKVSYSGGVFKAGALILDPFEAALGEGITLVEPRFSPVIGGALYAAQCYGRPLDEDALATVEKA